MGWSRVETIETTSKAVTENDRVPALMTSLQISVVFLRVGLHQVLKACPPLMWKTLVLPARW